MIATRSSGIAHVVAVLLDCESHRQQLVAVVQRRVDGARRHLLLDGPEVEAELALVAGFKVLSGMGVSATDSEDAKAYLPALLVAQGLAQDVSLIELGRGLRRLIQRGTFAREVIGQYRNHRPMSVLQLANDEQQANSGPAPGAGQYSTNCGAPAAIGS